jgi:hypothetical protein
MRVQTTFRATIVGTAILVSNAGLAAEEPACFSEQTHIADRAAGEAKSLLDTAIAANDNPKPSDLDRLQTWLGIVNSSDAQTVRCSVPAAGGSD